MLLPISLRRYDLWFRSHKPEDPAYLAATETARLLAEAGFAIITGGGPGVMEAANKGAHRGGIPLDWL